MSLYRQAGERGPALLAAIFAAGLLIGVLAGLLIGLGAAGEPTLGEQIDEARAELRPVAAGIELVPIEYEGAVEGGEVTAPTERGAAAEAVARAAAGLESSAAELRTLDPDGYGEAVEAVAALAAAVDATAPLARVERLAERAGARVEAFAGG